MVEKVPAAIDPDSVFQDLGRWVARWGLFGFGRHRDDGVCCYWDCEEIAFVPQSFQSFLGGVW